ncbi:hypothetical protein [Clostridium tagluense]|uniref:hypothetical protein n=1 Tax=Clostridium tagluense TaxID=360422 RepID=UPI001CF3B461|nr:hypothetical protein [Clostridium tagluense]MCB2299158.1 hypothetical protein [Clostridium tagluense]
MLSYSIIKNEIEILTSNIIVDDSFYSGIRSKSVELLAKVFDYVDCRYRKG